MQVLDRSIKDMKSLEPDMTYDITFLDDWLLRDGEVMLWAQSRTGRIKGLCKLDLRQYCLEYVKSLTEKLTGKRPATTDILNPKEAKIGREEIIEGQVYIVLDDDAEEEDNAPARSTNRREAL